VPPVFSPPEAARCVSRNRVSQRNARFWRTPQATELQILDSQLLTRSDCVSGRLKSNLAEGSSEEAATPEFPETRRSVSLKTLPPVHPREPPVTTSSAAVASRLNAAHACTAVTLRECRNNRNGKPGLRCAETVDDGTSLWKVAEKRKKTLGHRLGWIRAMQN
jgi:hypothetical protein